MKGVSIASPLFHGNESPEKIHYDNFRGNFTKSFAQTASQILNQNQKTQANNAAPFQFNSKDAHSILSSPRSTTISSQPSQTSLPFRSIERSQTMCPYQLIASGSSNTNSPAVSRQVPKCIKRALNQNQHIFQAVENSRTNIEFLRTHSQLSMSPQTTKTSLYFSKKPRYIEFTPYNIDDYRKIKHGKYYQLGGLGPSTIGSDAWMIGMEKQQRAQVYARSISDRNDVLARARSLSVIKE